MSGNRLLHLFIDFETTGLHPQADTVLEAGWVITDDTFVMLTPLRSRLTRIAPDRDNRPFLPEHPLIKNGIHAFRMTDHAAFLPDVVREMHLASGLVDDHEDAERDDDMSVLTHPRDFERLIMEDLVAAGFQRAKGDKLVISGAGVSHFDVNVMAVHWPEMFPLMPGPDDLAAYWQHDTSVAWRTLGKTVESAIRARVPLLSDFAPGDQHWSSFWSLFTAEAPADPDASHLVRVRDDGWAVLDRSAVRRHRAADDVVASLLDARMLRRADEILAE